jgi:hypothetical protein
MNKFLFLLAMLLIALHPVSASTGAELIVSIPDQTVILVEGGKLIARYRVSTSKFGNGDSSGSYRTPLGTLFVSGKFATICRPAPSLRIGCPPAK